MPDTKPRPAWLPFAIDYAPLILFFVVYKTVGVFAGTMAFMLAIVAAVLASKILLGRVSPMLWLSAILVVGFGALTIWFHDERFIQIKPTIIYAGLGVLLLGGVALRKPLIKYVLEAGLDGLSDRGWLLLSRNWGLFFITMAVLNEIMRHMLSFDTWLTLKVWALIPLSLAFGASQIPMMTREGLAVAPDKP
ncbi:Inner membrane-spanning protein YciB [Sphingomonas antarctica]|uniref:septation protein IspZ n=1 Tax=Sphingomonas antarctica TaxID=2040274 RepID=UPI0039EC9D1A